MRPVKTNVPNPSSEQVEYYLQAWDELENYHLQEDALDKLFSIRFQRSIVAIINHSIILFMIAM